LEVLNGARSCKRSQRMPPLHRGILRQAEFLTVLPEFFKCVDAPTPPVLLKLGVGPLCQGIDHLQLTVDYAPRTVFEETVLFHKPSGTFVCTVSWPIWG